MSGRQNIGMADFMSCSATDYVIFSRDGTNGGIGSGGMVCHCHKDSAEFRVQSAESKTKDRHDRFYAMFCQPIHDFERTMSPLSWSPVANEVQSAEFKVQSERQKMSAVAGHWPRPYVKNDDKDENENRGKFANFRQYRPGLS